VASPSEIRKETLKQLRKTVLKFSSAEWILKIRRRSEEEQKEAAWMALLSQRARLELENAELKEIREKLKENEGDLEEARTKLVKALGDLRKVKPVLKTVSSFINVIGRIVALV
jgi:hypothetical protein